MPRLGDVVTTPVHTTDAVDVTDHAEAFADTLTPAQRRDLYRRREPATLRAWSNLPQQVLGRSGRVGLSTATLTAVQWAALFDLLGAATGPGVDRIRSHLAADDLLRDLGGRHGYGRSEFTVAFLDPPTTDGTWTLQFGGHHLAVALTWTGGRLVGATPSFRGIEPFAPFHRDGVRHQPERASRDALAALLAALDGEQRDRAWLPGRHDILLGPGREWAFPTGRDGLAGTDLDPRQRSLLRAAIASYVDDLAPDDAARVLAGYVAELDDTYLGWSGNPDLNRVGDHVRIDGPSVWLEFSLHDGIVGAGPHPHAVWRDRVTDHGGTRF